jgi:hypothetical protein
VRYRGGGGLFGSSRIRNVPPISGWLGRCKAGGSSLEDRQTILTALADGWSIGADGRGADGLQW